MSNAERDPRWTKAARLVASIVAECNIEVAAIENDEGNEADPNTYGIAPETAEMYLEGFAEMVAEELKTIQPHIVAERGEEE